MLSATVKSPFELLRKYREQCDNDQIHKRYDSPCLKRLTGIGDDVFCLVDQLRKADDRENRGVLERDNELIDDRGYH